MNGYSFTNRVRKVLAMSREEALRLHHEYVGTEHILLGLLREGEGVASTVLENLSIDADWITQRIEELVKRGNAEPATGPELPYTSRAKKVLELAMAEAHDLHHSHVGTEHLLIGLLREEKGIAAQVLGAAGLTAEKARAETVRLVGTAPAKLHGWAARGGARRNDRATERRRLDPAARDGDDRRSDRLPPVQPVNTTGHGGPRPAVSSTTEADASTPTGYTPVDALLGLAGASTAANLQLAFGGVRTPRGPLPGDAECGRRLAPAVLGVVQDEQGLTGVPIVTGMDFGHTDPMMVLPYGASARVDPDARRVTIAESGVIP